MRYTTLLYMKEVNSQFPEKYDGRYTSKPMLSGCPTNGDHLAAGN
jgi:hypothetical protein